MSRLSTIYIISKVAITENNHQIGESCLRFVSAVT